MDNRSKRSTKQVFSLCTLFVFLVHTYAAINCPNVFVEIGNSKVIRCKSEKKLVDFYWYKGVSSGTTPILRLEDGKSGGSEVDSEHYAILSNGSMKIKNATIEQESFYTLVGYYGSADFDSSSFAINVTISPDPPCPVINQCENCTACHIKAEAKGHISCSITRSRPFIPLEWKFVHKNGVSFTKHQKQVVPNDKTLPVNSSIALNYYLEESCGVEALFQCVATDSSHILQPNVTSVYISTDRCASPTPNFAVPVGNGIVLIIICGVTVIAVIGALCLLFWIYRNRKYGHQIYMRIPKTNQEKVAHMKMCLKKAYEKHCFVKPLPWGEDIAISTLHTGCKCTITYPDERNLSVSSEDLLSFKHIDNEDRVLFIGNLGYGKTTFTKQMVHQWIHDQSATNYLLIYILLKDVKKEMNLEDIVMEAVPKDLEISFEDIQDAIRENLCLVILDGLDEMALSFEEKMEAAADENRSKCGLTIDELLQGLKRPTRTGMKVWVTSRELDNTKSPFPKPYSKVQMEGFSKIQMKLYIEKCCSYYLGHGKRSFDITKEPEFNKFKSGNKQFELPSKSKGADPEELNEEGAIKDSSLDLKEEKPLKEEGIAEVVEEFFETNHLFNDFSEDPLLFILMVHIMSAKYAGVESPNNSLVITRVSTLVGMVITALESRYFQKLDNTSVSEKIANLTEGLGKIAFERDVNLSVMERKFWEEKLGNNNLNVALGIGLLKQSKVAASEGKVLQSLASSSFSGIEFYHRSIQEYFAAIYFVNNQETLLPKLQTLIKKHQLHQSFSVLKFISGIVEAPIKKICKFLLEEKMYNIVIDCLFEAILHNVKNDAFHETGQHAIDITGLDEKYHRDAVRAFCNQCKTRQITVESITFFSDCHLWFLRTLKLPNLKSLTFFKAAYTESDFRAIIKMFSDQKVTETLWFVECKIPEKIRHLEDEGLDLKHPVITIKRKESYADLTFVSFDFQNGVWKKEVKGFLAGPIEMIAPK